MSEEEFAAKCPVCRNNCNCKSCLRMKGPHKVYFLNYNLNYNLNYWLIVLIKMSLLNLIYSAFSISVFANGLLNFFHNCKL